MRPVHDPYGGVNPLIDKMIGNAYDVVKYVARYLKEIRYVAENMQHIYEAAQSQPTKRIVLTAQGTGLESLQIPLPEGVTGENVFGISSVIYAHDAAVGLGSTAFEVVVVGEELLVQISDYSLRDGEIRAVIDYIPD